MEEFYSVKQVQEILKVDRITIYRMLNDGRLKGIKIGQQWRFPHSEIERMLSGEEVTGIPGGNQLAAIGPDATFPTHCIQTIQNLYSEISRFGAVVVDMNGFPLTSFSRPTKFSALLMSSVPGRASCHACWKQAAEHSATRSLVNSHAGMQFLAAPIYDRGAQIGALITGPFYWQDSDENAESDRIQQLAVDYHLDSDALINAAREIQIIPEDRHAQVEGWPRSTVDAMHSILNERSSFLTRLQQIADLTQVA
jgi:excisionase family DNA binding protein